MKKTIIAGASVGALGLAVLPFTGVFAAVSEHTDTVTVTVSPSCSMVVTRGSGADNVTGSEGAFTYTKGIANGGTESALGGTRMEISCNSSTGWKLQAIGAGEASGDVSKMKATSGNGADIVSNTRTTGDSAWAMKVTGTGQVSDQFVVVPTTATKVASGAGGVSGNPITALYQVHIGSTQASGSYTGKVKYTVSAGQN